MRNYDVARYIALSLTEQLPNGILNNIDLILILKFKLYQYLGIIIFFDIKTVIL